MLTKKHPFVRNEIVESVEVRHFERGKIVCFDVFVCQPSKKKIDLSILYYTSILFPKNIFSECVHFTSTRQFFFFITDMYCTTRAAVATFSSSNLYQHAQREDVSLKIKSNEK